MIPAKITHTHTKKKIPHTKCPLAHMAHISAGPDRANRTVITWGGLNENKRQKKLHSKTGFLACF